MRDIRDSPIQEQMEFWSTIFQSVLESDLEDGKRTIEAVSEAYKTANDSLKLYTTVRNKLEEDFFDTGGTNDGS